MPNSIEQDIAYQIFIGMQMSISEKHLENSILSMARKFPTQNPLDYTEDYFYEEMIFASVLALETEWRFGFITWTLDARKKVRGDAGKLGPADIYRGMTEIFYPVACERMRLVRLQPTPPANIRDLETRLLPRFPEYETLAKSATQNSDPLPERDWTFGLSRREHPLEKYLGAVSDHLCESLSGLVQAVEHSAIETAVLAKWNISMNVAKEVTRP